MTGRAHWWWLAALMLLASPAAAQEDELAPPVEIEDVDVEKQVVPLDDAQETTVDVRVGCEAHEAPTTDTLVTLTAPRSPEWLNVVISPGSFAWTTSPEDCPSTGTPFERTTEILVSADQDAPAYEPVVVRLEAQVVKQPPGEAEERTYGPYTGNVSLTPGYFNLYNARTDTKIKQADPGQRLTFETTIASFSNHETAFTMSAVDEPDDISVSYDPARLVLAPNETGTFSTAIRPANDGEAPRGVVSIETMIDSRSTHELGDEGSPSRISFLAKFQADRTDPRDTFSVPAASTATSLASLATVALAAAAAKRRRP